MAEDGYVIKSPLALWPGKIVLPNPERFNGVMWQDWRKALEDTKAPAINRLHFYAALRFIKKHGKWEMDLPLDEAAGWENKPSDELMMPVSWLGKQMQLYMNRILDPKE